MRHPKISITIATLALAGSWAHAQVAPQSPPTGTGNGAQSSGSRTATPTGREDLEPAVNTSAGPAPDSKPAAASPAPAASAASAPAAAAPQPPARGKADPAAARSGAAAKSGKAMDRIELDTTQITGNRELPKVLYIVPWKRSDLGDLTGKPVNSLLDEVLEPVDRGVF